MDENMMRKSALRAKRWNIIIFSIFAVMFTVLLIGVCVFKYQHTYSKNKWDTDKERRYKIVSDMLNKNPLIGLTEGEVVALLGEEDGNGPTSFKISRKYFPPESTLVYYLGVDIIDNNWLVISLQNNVVTDYCIDRT